jgi:hypothetical protein
MFFQGGIVAMLQKRRSGRLRRILTLEALEDRTLLSGNVLVSETPAGVVTIVGDNGNNVYNINQTNLLVAPTLSVIGVGTAINGVSNGTANFVLASVNAISITEGNGNNTVNLGNTRGSRIPGNLQITTGSGSNQFTLNNLAAAALSFTSGNGSTTLRVDNSTLQQADITAGTETPGATGSNSVELSGDTITGNHVTINLLNQSGVSGVLLSGAHGLSPGSVNTLSMNNDRFTAASGPGNLNIRIDDGVPYVNAGRLTAASAVAMTALSTPGNISATLGDHFQSVRLGTGTIGTSQIVAKNLTLSVENDVDTVLVTSQTSQNETLTVGNVSTSSIPPLPAPFSLVNGNVGGNLNITIGSNANPNLVHGWPLTLGGTTATTEIHIGGKLTLVAGDGLAITLEGDASSVGSTTDITMGSGGLNHVESLMLARANVGAGDPTLHFNSNRGDTVTIDLTDVQCLAGDANLVITDSGHGKDIVNLLNVFVGGFLQITLSDSGQNVVTSQNVTVVDVDDSFINGGGGGSIYKDLGGNSLPDTNPPLIGFENIPPEGPG